MTRSMDDIYLEFGRDGSGELIHVSQADRGLESELTCPYCRVPLIAKKGRQVRHHFAHHGATCRDSTRGSHQVPLYRNFFSHFDATPRQADFLLKLYDEFGVKVQPSRAPGMGWEKSRRFFKKCVNNELIAWDSEVHAHTLSEGGRAIVGDLSLAEFERLYRRAVEEIDRDLREELAERPDHDDSASTALELLRKQRQWLLLHDLYFLEVTLPDSTLQKIGIVGHERELEDRVDEIRRFLQGEFADVQIRVLGHWPHRAHLEHYFLWRYRDQQTDLAGRTEYFEFGDAVDDVFSNDLSPLPEFELTRVDAELLSQTDPVD